MPRRVLIVDAGARVGGDLRRVLRRHGFGTTAAARVAGLGRAAGLSHDLVLIDVTGLRAEAMEAIRRLRRLRPRLHIVAMAEATAGLAAHAILEIAQASGADRILFKPFTTTDLLAVLASD